MRRLQNNTFGIKHSMDSNSMWYSLDIWKFKTKDGMIFIENASKRKVLEVASNGNVYLKDIEEDKPEQLWKKGKPNAEGFFTLENVKVQKLMTAIKSKFNMNIVVK